MNHKGYTLIELLLVMSIFAVLSGIAAVNLGNFQHKSQLNANVLSLIANIRGQQVKSMVGDGEGTGTAANYGIRFGTTSYTLYRTSYGTANYVVTLPSTLQVSVASASSDLVFLKGSGEIPGHTTGTAVITLQDTVDNTQKVIRINRYGVITSVN
jgi:prepilin-type N-terminal cleavage/methylation domain-containing protein